MSLRDLVSDAAGRFPDAIAVEDDRGATTYAALDDLANQLAHALAGVGVGPGMRVGVWAHKSARTIAGMQAVLRLGAVYVPLDPKSPPARIASIVTQAQLHALLVDDAHDPPDDRPAVNLDQPRVEDRSPVCLGDRSDADLVYILFTSGSTGTPKGVCISERNACAFVDWAVAALRPDRRDRFSNHAPFHFDLSVLDLYAAFSVGARVCIVPDGIAYSPGRLVRFVADRGITVWYSVPSALILMMQQGGLLDTPTPSLRTILFAGEPFPVKHLRALVDSRPGVRFLNFYGPTETNVCTAYEVHELDPARTSPVPIGVAASGDRVWAADASGQPVAMGDVGELWVAGPTVMHGYWGRTPHEGPYPTGDLVRPLASGDFEYVGRRDAMVKVRGHRVELGDVEAALLAHPRIVDACVLLRGEGMHATLVAFVVGDGDGPTLLQTKQHCAGLLPAYMIPGEVRRLDVLPRTRNGKIDRSALEHDLVAA